MPAPARRDLARPRLGGCWYLTWQHWRLSPDVIAGALAVIAVTLLAVSSIEWGEPRESFLTRAVLAHSPHEIDTTVIPPSAPDRSHVLGTDWQGRDLLSRLLHGSRISLFVGVSAEAIALLLGLGVGTVAGYAGGRADALLMRGADVLLAFPLPIIAMGAMAMMDRPSLAAVFLILGLMGWGGIARVVRGEVLSLREREFSEAARALGAGGTRIAFKHLLPHALAPAMVVATVGIAGNILTEAWLSFLGLGARQGEPSWGLIISEARTYLTTRPSYCIIPGLALVFTIAGFLLLADGMRRALDPRQRERVGAL